MIKICGLLDKIKEIQCYDFLSVYKVERDLRIKIKLQALVHLRNGKTIQEVLEITFKINNHKNLASFICGI